MESYYSEKLSAERLKRVYDLAPPAARRYLTAEIEHVRQRVEPGSRVLELGCGYGRVMRELAPGAGRVVGVDTSLASLRMGRAYLAGLDNVLLSAMDAVEPAFPPRCFDVVCCVQNGISAFRVDRRMLMRAAAAITRPGGRVLFSSYAEEFWEDRLEWFRGQASNGLLGEIDEATTGAGTIVCKDGFVATTVSPDEFRRLSRGLGKTVTVEVVAASSLFCEIHM